MTEQRWTLEDAARAIVERYIQKSEGTRVRRIEVGVAGSSQVLGSLEQLGLVWRHDTLYYPRFRTLRYVDENLRKHGENCTEMVLKALRLLYRTDDISPNFPFHAIQATIKSGIDRTAEDEMILLGMLFSCDFLQLLAGWNGTPGARDHSLIPRSEILGFDTIQVAWEKELESERVIQQSVLARARADTPIQPKSLGTADFSFLSDPKLRSVIERDYIELGAIRNGVKSRIILSGGLLEGLLLDALLPETARARKSRLAENKDLHEWKLQTLVDVAAELGLLSEGPKQMGHSVRDFRNLVHPGKEVRGDYVVHEAEAQAAEAVVAMTIRDLSQRKRNKANAGSG